MKTFPFCVDEYSIKTHFNALGSNFPLWWACIWTNTEHPNTSRRSLCDILKRGNDIVNISRGLFRPKTWEETLFIKWQVVRTTCPHRFLEHLKKKKDKKALVTFSK